MTNDAITATPPPDSPVATLLRRKNIALELEEHDLKRLSVKSPVLYIANQTLETLDELMLIELLSRQSLPFKIISRNKTVPPELSGHFLQLDFNILQWEDYVKAILKSITKAKESGTSLCVALHFTDNSLDTLVRDQFLNRLMKAILRAEIPIVPVRLKAPFPDFVRPAIGGRLILANRKEPYRVSVRVGSQISVEDQQKFPSPKDFRRYVQSKIFSLGSGLDLKPFFLWKLFKNENGEKPLAQPIDPQLIEQEMAALPAGNLIAAQGEFDIFVAEAKQIPNTLKEIGRLRELTFRTVGEGTGNPADNDQYDLYYRQLILWDREAKRLAGGYRMGLGEEIFERYGVGGFYISAMFKIKEGFHPTMRQSVELGRSYIIPDYQKKRLPLFLLWKGILYFLLKNPQYRYLYGPVSISKYYSNLSRSLIVAFIQNHYFDHELAQCLKPRKPFKAKVEKVDIEMLADSLGSELGALDNLIEDIEPEHFKIPVLVRQYLKLNARFISFNVDPNFSDVLDGFIILDLNNVPPAMLEMLKKEAG